MFPEAQPHRKDGRLFSELPAYALTFQDEHGTARIATETTGATSAIVCCLSPVDAVFLEHFANRKACLIGMEACGSAQHWAPRLIEAQPHRRCNCPPPKFQALRRATQRPEDEERLPQYTRLRARMRAFVVRSKDEAWGY
jgi:transposase